MSNLLNNALCSKVLFSDEELKRISACFKPRVLKKRQLLVTQGEVALYLAFIEKGLMRSYLTARDGKEHILNFYFEEHWVSDLNGFHRQMPATLNVEAVEASELLLIDHGSFYRLFDEVPKLERFWRITYENAYNALQQRYIAIQSRSAEELYTDLLAHRPEFFERLPQYQIASYLGMTPENLSRLRKKQLAKDD